MLQVDVDLFLIFFFYVHKHTDSCLRTTKLGKFDSQVILIKRSDYKAMLLLIIKLVIIMIIIMIIE